MNSSTAPTDAAICASLVYQEVRRLGYLPCAVHHPAHCPEYGSSRPDETYRRDGPQGASCCLQVCKVVFYEVVILAGQLPVDEVDHFRLEVR